MSRCALTTVWQPGACSSKTSWLGGRAEHPMSLYIVPDGLWCQARLGDAACWLQHRKLPEPHYLLSNRFAGPKMKEDGASEVGVSDSKGDYVRSPKKQPQRHVV
jgi:hypothetical protein